MREQKDWLMMFYLLKLCCSVSLCKLCKTVNSCTSTNWKLFTEKYSLHMNVCIIMHHSLCSKCIENLYYFCTDDGMCIRFRVLLRAEILMSN